MAHEGSAPVATNIPVEQQGSDYAAAANAADVPTRANAPSAVTAPGKLGSNLTAFILKIAFVALLGISLCVAATGIIIAVAFGLKGASGRSQR
jgi:hypothetical protein